MVPGALNACRKKRKLRAHDCSEEFVAQTKRVPKCCLFLVSTRRANKIVKSVRKRMRLGLPPQQRGTPHILFPTVFPIDFLRIEVQFLCSVCVLRRDGISVHVWYERRTHLQQFSQGDSSQKATRVKTPTKDTKFRRKPKCWLFLEPERTKSFQKSFLGFCIGFLAEVLFFGCPLLGSSPVL